jgi:hypothetical protein
MTYRVNVSCNYCGKSYNQIIVFRGQEVDPCPRCFESKDLKVIPLEDVYGYNDQSPKKDAYIKKDP